MMSMNCWQTFWPRGSRCCELPPTCRGMNALPRSPIQTVTRWLWLTRPAGKHAQYSCEPELSAAGPALRPAAEFGDALPGEVGVDGLAAGHGQDQREQRAGHLRAIAVGPLGVGGLQPQAGNPPLGSDQ